MIPRLLTHLCDRDGVFELHFEAELAQLLREARTISPLEQAGTQVSMDLHGAREDSAGQFTMYELTHTVTVPDFSPPDAGIPVTTSFVFQWPSVPSPWSPCSA
jgi:hypothetical protein